MLEQENRLKKRKQFNYIFKNGKRVSCAFATLIVQKANAKNHKIGFSVNKKVGNAVVRNKAKRRLKEIARNINAKDGNMFVLVAKPNVATANFAEIETAIKRMFQKNGLLKDE